MPSSLVARVFYGRPLPDNNPNGNLSTSAGWSAVEDMNCVRQGAFTWTDDGTVRYTFKVWGRATSLVVNVRPTWQARIYDIDNAQVIIGPTDEITLPWYELKTITEWGPIGTMPSSDARWRLEYTGGGNGAEIFGALFEVYITP